MRLSIAGAAATRQMQSLLRSGLLPALGRLGCCYGAREYEAVPCGTGRLSVLRGVLRAHSLNR